MENQTKALILVVDDDRDIAEAIRIYLAAADYRVLIARDGVEALELLSKHHDVNLVIMDVMMPRMDGIAATLRIREERNLPILMLTAKSEETDLVEGLNAGADDYITKPFSAVELLARVRSSLRRYQRLGGELRNDAILRVGSLELDTDSRLLTVDGDKVRLTATEYRILELFMKNVGRVLSIGQIYTAVWNDQPVSAEKTVAVHIRRLREKVEIDPARPRYIRVVWGIGYVMKEDSVQ